MIELRMPSLGADMDAGTIVEWRVGPGDHVDRGDIVAVVETQKAAIEIESFETGTVDKLVVETGRKVPVGTVIALFREDGEAARPAAGRTPTVRVAPRTAAGLPPTVRVAPPPAAGNGERLRISPAARRRARELDVDPHGLRGTGPHGSIVLRDIEAAAAGPAAPPVEVRPPAPVEVRPPAPVETRAPVEAPAPAGDRRAQVRAAIAATMSRSKREIPHYYLEHRINMKAALRWLEAANASRGVAERLLPAVLLIKAVARVLPDFPDLNGHHVDGEYRPADAIHVGMAVSLRGGGVIAPALHDANHRSLDDLMANLADVVKRARAGTLRSSEMSEATITITSLGERGSETVYGVIIPPQVAMVGFGAILPRPWVVEGGVIAQPVVTATLSADHRVSDGHRGGLFLTALDQLLQEPDKL
jgi:pyruvate dehydrogenase E2 component (dihydrolipoamide acetyltransferase)